MHDGTVALDARRSIHEGLPLSEDFHEQAIDPVDLVAHLRHGLGRFGRVMALVGCVGRHGRGPVLLDVPVTWGRRLRQDREVRPAGAGAGAA